MGRSIEQIKRKGKTKDAIIESKDQRWHCRNRITLVFALTLSIFASNQAMAIVYTEDFSNPLSDWVSGWLYTGSNLQNYYVATGTCDDNNRGNQPDGLWVSDDKACGSLNSVSPVTINLDANLGDTAAFFSLDAYACGSNVTLNIYDRDGVLDSSLLLPSSCLMPITASIKACSNQACTTSSTMLSIFAP